MFVYRHVTSRKPPYAAFELPVWRTGFGRSTAHSALEPREKALGGVRKFPGSRGREDRGSVLTQVDGVGGVRRHTRWREVWPSQRPDETWRGWMSTATAPATDAKTVRIGIATETFETFETSFSIMSTTGPLRVLSRVPCQQGGLGCRTPCTPNKGQGLGLVLAPYSSRLRSTPRARSNRGVAVS